MRITDQLIDQAYFDCKATCGGVRNDYFGLLFLQHEYDVPREEAIQQVAFGGSDYGIDGFHFDKVKRNLYLFQFKYSESHQQFKVSFQRLIDTGMQYVFNAEGQDKQQNQLLQQIKSCLIENTAVIDRVLIHFIFLGDPQSAEQSPVLDKLREDLENKKYLVETALGRPVPLVIEFRSARTKKVGGPSNIRKSHSYPIQLTNHISRGGPAGESLHVGFVRAVDLHAMFMDMGQRFFERNIRGSLSPESSVNRSLERTFRSVVLEEKESPLAFSFNHNGITLSAEELKQTDSGWRITEPRLLNGAQTITSFARFLKGNENNPKLSEHRETLEAMNVLCRVITDASPEFVTSVTISNNRQNWVKPWNLRANDMIQLELQEKFRDDLNLYYERQEKAFENLSDEDLEEMGIVPGRAIELFKLGRTFLVVDGNLDKLNRYPEVFEDDKMYGQVFSEARKKADSRKIVLCYKAERRLNQFIRDILEMGQKKYAFVKKGRNLLWALLCQGILNDPKLDQRAEQWGQTLSVESDFVEWLSGVATTRCRMILKDLIEDKQYADKVEEGNFNFFRTNATYKRAMVFGYNRFKWVERTLR
jgi:hypothetical protein